MHIIVMCVTFGAITNYAIHQQADVIYFYFYLLADITVKRWEWQFGNITV